VNESTLQSRIEFLVSQLRRDLIPESKRLEIRTELDNLLSLRRRMLETLAKHNTYMPEIIDDSSNDDDE